MKTSRTYTFIDIQTCHMCSAPEAQFRVLGKRLNRSQGARPVNRSGIATTVMQCRKCGLIFANPLPIPASISDHYGVPPEDYWDQEYLGMESSYFESEITTLKRLSASSPAGLKTLDIGAGIGKQMVALTKAGFDPYGLEPSEPFYDRAIARTGIEPERLQCKAVEEADYPTDHFGFISFGAVFEHLYFPGRVLEKVLQWHKPGGLVHLEVPSTNWLTNKIVNFAYRIQGLDYVANLSPMHQPYHLCEFSPESFDAHGTQHGYQVAYKRYYVCTTYLPTVLDPILKPIMARTHTGMQLCVWLRKALPGQDQPKGR